MFPRCVIIMNFVVVSSVVMKRVVCIFLGSPWKHVSGSVPVSIPITCKVSPFVKEKLMVVYLLATIFTLSIWTDSIATDKSGYPHNIFLISRLTSVVGTHLKKGISIFWMKKALYLLL